MGKRNPNTDKAAQKGKGPDISDFIVAEEELKALKKEQGIQDSSENLNALGRAIDYILTARERRIKQPIKKKTYLWLCLLGAFGLHRFYAKQWFTATVYLLTCWTGFSMAMTIIDAMIVIPMKADENGIIWL